MPDENATCMNSNTKSVTTVTGQGRHGVGRLGSGGGGGGGKEGGERGAVGESGDAGKESCAKSRGFYTLGPTEAEEEAEQFLEIDADRHCHSCAQSWF